MMGRRADTTYIATDTNLMITFVFVTPTPNGCEVGHSHEPAYKDMEHFGQRLHHGQTAEMVRAMLDTLPVEHAAAVCSAHVRRSR